MPAVSSRAIFLSHTFPFLYPVLQASVYHPGGVLRLCSNAGMGFFSSRKPYDDYVATDKSVVHVIRSRFVRTSSPPAPRILIELRNNLFCSPSLPEMNRYV